MNTSINHQQEYGGKYGEYIEAMTCLYDLIHNAELIEIHVNYKGNNQLKQTYVLVSAFKGTETITPVQFEVKEFSDDTHGLYIIVVLTKIEEPAVVSKADLLKSNSSYLVDDSSTISLADIFTNVNPVDKRFLKYVLKCQ